MMKGLEIKITLGSSRAFDPPAPVVVPGPPKAHRWPRSYRIQDPCLQQVEFGTTEHLSLDIFKFTASMETHHLVLEWELVPAFLSGGLRPR
jgi:hypothetical protein